MLQKESYSAVLQHEIVTVPAAVHKTQCILTLPTHIVQLHPATTT